MAVACLAVSAVAFQPVATRLRAENDLDAFMRQVLARRDDNWKKLQQYILDEREQIEVRGSNLQPIWGERRDYTWFIRDGFFVRSPIRVNGAEVGEGDRRKYESEYLRRNQDRDRRAQQLGLGAGGPDGARASAPDARTGDADDGAATDNDQKLDGLLKQVREPQFVSSAYFLRFRFEEGKYALVGRETLDGNQTLRVEYYPANLFTDRQRRRMARDHDPRDPRDAEIERMMNKVALVTLWIEPTSHQIVKYTFDNVDFDFLPAKWLVRLDSLKATMTMSQPFTDVWLPRELEFLVDAQIAVGRFNVRWGVEYRDYRQPDVKSRFRVAPDR